MKNAILAFALAAVAVSCTQSSEETSTETIVDSTAIYEDAAYGDTTVTAEGEEASAE
jgi:hypothetical protein